MKYQKVIVTGGSGKAGLACLERLSQAGYRVLSLDQKPLPGEIPGVESLVVDLADFGQTVDAMKGFEAVVHLAAFPHNGIITDERTFRINTASTFNVFHAARVLEFKRVVWASSETVLGLPFDTIKPAEAPIDESHAPYPNSTYSLSKSVGEEMARQFHRWTGIPYIGLRFSNIIRPWEYDMFEGFQEDAGKRQWNLWGYVDSRDAAQSCQRALEADFDGVDNFIIAAADTVMRKENKDLLAGCFPDCALRPGTGPNETLLSIEKAHRVLGYEPEYSWREQAAPS